MAQLTFRVGLSLSNILVLTDFSAASLAAVTCIAPVAKESGSVIHLLHVIRPKSEIPSSGVHEDLGLKVQTDAQHLEAAIATVPHKIWLREGNVWPTAEDLVRSQHIDLIVVGTTGESDFIGSGAEEIIRKAVCPVLSVGPHAAVTGDHAPLTQLLYVMNLWEGSHDGLEYSVQLAIRYKSRLLLLHVVEQEEAKQSDNEWLKAYRRIMRNRLPESTDNLAEGPVLRVEVAKNISARILQVADEVRADLVILDVTPEPPGATHLPQTLHEIISGASCPVLTVQSKKGEPPQG